MSESKLQNFKFEKEIIDKIYHNITMRAILEGSNKPETKSQYLRRLINEDYDKWKEKLFGKKDGNIPTINREGDSN